MIHALIWLGNYWLVAFAMDINWTDFTNSSGSLAYAYAYGLCFNACLFYFQARWLMPKLYIRNKKALFYTYSLAFIALISLIETYLDFTLFDLFNIQTQESFSGLFSTNAIIHLIYSLAGFFYIFRKEYKKAEQSRQQLLAESYQSELKYLKAQLNPHFLFNGINSVYHLIGKNNDLAKETLLQFSELLRYQLYENSSHIRLEKELDYVLQYIKIEETRKGEDIHLQYNIEFENGTKKIAPLLLIPFIENAFKHCSHHVDESKNIIQITILERENVLTLEVLNSFHEKTNTSDGGIGLTNVKRRLSLLYPEQYRLDIKTEQSIFNVQLSINL